MYRTFSHPYHDIRVHVDEEGRALLEFGGNLRGRMAGSDDWSELDDIPMDGEVIRVAWRLYEVGMMDTSDPPLLHSIDEGPDCGLWWDADADEVEQE